MKGYIYETTNLINGKKYIGKHKSNRFDENYYGSGIALKRALDKYGKENFKVKILEEVEDISKLSSLETYYIKKFDAVKNKNYYNNSYGGESEGWQGINLMFKDNPEKWRKSREKSSKSQTGQKRTEETKKKISESLKGKPKSKEHIDKIIKSRNYSSETKYKLGLNFGTLGKPSPIKGKTAENSEWVRKSRDNAIKTKNSKKWKETKGLEARKKISNTRIEKGIAKGKNNPMYGTKTAYVSNRDLDIAKRVKIEDVEIYLLNGWIKGNIHKMK